MSCLLKNIIEPFGESLQPSQSPESCALSLKGTVVNTHAKK